MQPPATPALVERPRSADEIAAVLDGLLAQAGFGPAGADALRDALVRIAARYGELVTGCLNAAPGLHLAALAELLGRRAAAPGAATVHLSFRPAPGSASSPVVVPMHTRVAAEPGPGESEPAVYETLADLTLVRAEAVSALFVDAGHRRLADAGAMLSMPGRDGDPLAASAAVPCALHIAQEAVFGLPGLRQLRIGLALEDGGTATEADWCMTTPHGERVLAVAGDGTAGLTRSGEVLLVPPPDWPQASIGGATSRWLTLRARLRPAADAAAPPWRPPRLRGLLLGASATLPARPAVAACHDGVPLDLSKDFPAFGELPRFGSLFQLHSPAFGEPGAKIEVAMRLTNPAGASSSPIPPVSRDGLPVVAWEISTAQGFRELAASDGTLALTQDGSLVFTVPGDVAAVTIAGVGGAWLRGRLASGHYGAAPATDAAPFPLPHAPSIRTLTVQSTLQRGPLPAEFLVAEGALTRGFLDPRLPVPVDAFALPDVDGPALHLGLAAAAGALDARTVLNWHVRPAAVPPPLAAGAPAASGGAALPRWQLRDAGGWRDLAVQEDGSAGLTRPGIVRLVLPQAPAPWLDGVPDAALRLRWLRIVWPAGAAPARVLPRGLALNSVAARHSQRLRDEVVGSGNGRAGQRFAALRTPIVGEAVLQVREDGERWTTWQEVDGFDASGPASRHYTLDRAGGELRFGDGRRGRMPPAGVNNVRLHEYATGGGARGNRPAGSITRLLGALPAVASVVNVEPAAGGFDAEPPARARGRAAAWLRHRDRALCADDHADLALQAAPGLARAYCVAGRDLAPGAPAGGSNGGPTRQDGVVSLIVIPHGSEPRPQPDAALLAAVHAHVEARRPPLGRLVVVGPSYAPAAVTLRFDPLPGWSAHEVAADCAARIARFLHPLAGGARGRGWAPGERPHRSDLHGLLAGVEGIAAVRALGLRIDARPGWPCVVAAGAIDASADG